MGVRLDLRELEARVHDHEQAATSTFNGKGDQGADPNKLVAVTDTLSATSPGTESGGDGRDAGSAKCCGAPRLRPARLDVTALGSGARGAPPRRRYAFLTRA